MPATRTTREPRASAYNRLTPINSLPHEIPRLFFEYTVDSFPHSPSYPRLQSNVSLQSHGSSLASTSDGMSQLGLIDASSFSFLINTPAVLFFRQFSTQHTLIFPLCGRKTPSSNASDSTRQSTTEICKANLLLQVNKHYCNARESHFGMGEESVNELQGRVRRVLYAMHSPPMMFCSELL
ncbi:hypothetical protein BDY19DRAFT_461229 [Irpex rosettiformis]|uniref:Uncharacterized protein n=1 Tax=Irpex rosettiformis TaxID=378272 RepID=A0ACB8TSG3_9APHY|nr:hypothetical protein BDY19DRAFT_461229 [Irpex rosettiformis]